MARPAASTTPRLDRCTEPVPEKLRTQVLRELGKLHARINELETLLDTTASEAALADSPYVTYSATASLSAERRLVDGVNTTVNISTPGQIAIDGAAAGAPTGAQYVTLATHASLSAERVLTAGTGITVTDGGANAAVTIATTITQYTDEMAQDAVGGMATNSSTVSLTYVDAAPSLTAAVIAGSIDTTQLADDGVTFAKLQNITNKRLIGRDAVGSGSPEEIAVTNGLEFTGSQQIGIANDGVTFARMQNIATDRLLGRDTAGSGDVEEISLGDGLQFSGAQVLSVDYAAVANRVIYEVDFTSLANNTFVNGTETIDGLNWTAASVSNTSRTIFDIQNGTGLRWTAPTSSATSFTTASQTSAHIYIDISAFTLLRPEECLIVELQYSGTFENGNDGLRFGLWGQANTPSSAGTASVIRMDMLDRVNNGGTQALRTLHQAATVNFEVDPTGTDVVMGKFYNDGSIDAFYGTYSGGFPTNAYIASGRQTSTQGAKNPMMCQNTRLTLAFLCVSDASPTSAVTITRMRLRRGI